jgi:glycosyltransferase involved in cell wall biosynthesis
LSDRVSLYITGHDEGALLANGVGDRGRPIRVAQVVFDLDGGGLESLVAAMAHRFARSSVAMSVITLSGRVGRVGATVRPLLDEFHILRPISGLSMVAPVGLIRCLRRLRPHVVHLHSGAWYKGAAAARWAGVPRIVYTEHGREHHDPPVLRWLDRRASRWTDVVVAVSDRLRRYLEARIHIPPNRIRTIESGVDVNVFSPGPRSRDLLDELAIPADALIVGSVGRLERVKAYERLIEAFARLRTDGDGHRPLYLVIGGEGSERQALRDCAQRWGVAGNVRFPGWVERPAELYRLLDVFALTSLSEGASISLMEAMACGAAPVVMAVGANAEILGPDLQQQVVPAGDVEALRRTIAATLLSREERDRVRGLARQRVNARYRLDRMITEYEDVYRAGASLCGVR